MDWHALFNKQTTVRRFAQQYIWSGVRKGLNPYKIVKGLKNANLSYRNQWMYRDVKFWKSVIDKMKSNMELDPNTVITEKDTLPYVFHSNYKYLAHFNVMYDDPLTGEAINREVTFPLGYYEGDEFVGLDHLEHTPAEMWEMGLGYNNKAMGSNPIPDHADWKYMGVWENTGVI